MTPGQTPGQQEIRQALLRELVAVSGPSIFAAVVMTFDEEGVNVAEATSATCDGARLARMIRQLADRIEEGNMAIPEGARPATTPGRG
jgi:hypothetical protein